MLKAAALMRAKWLVLACYLTVIRYDNLSGGGTYDVTGKSSVVRFRAGIATDLRRVCC
jgi:hypothetical protein